MTAPPGTGQAAQPEASSYVDQAGTFGGGADPAPPADAAPETNAGIEKDVGTILAGLNQEQLASIVAAAVRTH